MRQLFYDDPDVEALARVKSKLDERDRRFAESLIEQSRLTDKQRHWVKVLTDRAINPQTPAKIDFSGVVALLDGAAKNLKKPPKLLVRVSGQDLRLSIAGPRSAAPGSVNISTTERAFADRTWYGRVTRDGVFEPSRMIDNATSTAVTAALKALAADPAKIAATYGKLTGVCCFCALDLTDPRSKAVGYGKRCAQKWGMPWGKTA